jgi:hypothetical protein
MATSPVPQWAQEMSPHHRGPTGGGVLRLAVLVLVVVICWQWFVATDSGASQVDRKPGVSFCQEHKGEPAWDSICAETARRHRR